MLKISKKMIFSILLLTLIMFPSYDCNGNEDLSLFISNTVVNSHDFSYILNPEFEICKTIDSDISLLVYGEKVSNLINVSN